MLPLVDVVSEVAKEHGSAAEVVTRHQPEIWTFLLSFVVIIRLWMAHHRTFQHVGAVSKPLMLCNAGWLLTIVVLPFPTEMVGVYGGDRFTVGLYIGTILLATGFQTAMNLIIRADTLRFRDHARTWQRPGERPTGKWRVRSAHTAVPKDRNVWPHGLPTSAAGRDDARARRRARGAVDR